MSTVDEVAAALVDLELRAEPLHTTPPRINVWKPQTNGYDVKIVLGPWPGSAANEALAIKRRFWP